MRLKPALWQAAWQGQLPREARDTLLLLAVIAWIIGLQAPYIPVWCTVLALLVLGWRATLAVVSRPLPGWPWRLTLLLLALGGVLLSHDTLLGQDAWVTWIVVLLAVKTLELRARRDALVVCFLGFFILLTHLLHSQSLLSAMGMLVAVWGLLSALVLAHMPVGRPPIRQATRLAGTMALLGAPIMLALFLLFPRFGPLWSLPTDGATGRSGLSGQMQVGQIARLAQDHRIAFRVEFADQQTPPQNLLYFRGPVLSVFNGLQWEPRHPPTAPTTATELPVTTSGGAIAYRLTMEPTSQPWVLTLEATPRLSALLGRQLYSTPDLQWLTREPINNVLRFDAVAYPQFRHGPLAHDATLQSDLELPAGFNPRTLQLAQSLRAELGHSHEPQAYVAAVLERLRSGGYTYTLEPGLFGRHSADEFWFDRRQGFCEHIASSFVILMRALDIPARLVTGYHGGERNPVDGLWIVRQSDAHAWAEVWLSDSGWTRIDPTAYVAPARTAELQRLTPPPGAFAQTLLPFDPTLLWQMRSLWEASNNRWNQWVLNYAESNQLDLLRRLGLHSPNWTDLLLLLAGLLALVSLAGAGWATWQRSTRDPWLRLLELARQRVRSSAAEVPPQATPRQLAALLPHSPEPPGAHAAWAQWLLCLEAQRYDPSASMSLRALQRQFKSLPPWPKTAPPPNPDLQPTT